MRIRQFEPARVQYCAFKSNIIWRLLEKKKKKTKNIIFHRQFHFSMEISYLCRYLLQKPYVVAGVKKNPHWMINEWYMIKSEEKYIIHIICYHSAVISISFFNRNNEDILYWFTSGKHLEGKIKNEKVSFPCTIINSSYLYILVWYQRRSCWWRYSPFISVYGTRVKYYRILAYAT